MREDWMPPELLLFLLGIGLLVGSVIMIKVYGAMKRRLLERERMYPESYASVQTEEECMYKMRQFLGARIMYVEKEIHGNHKEFLKERAVWGIISNGEPFPEALRALFRLCTILKLRVVIVEAKDVEELKEIVYRNGDVQRKWLDCHRWTLF